MRPRSMRFLPLALAVGLLPTSAGADSLIPDSVPVPVLTRPVQRGSLVLSPADPITPTVKTVDGDPSDWIGTPTRYGGTSVTSAGELIYQDYLNDDHGADDGQDAGRISVLAPLHALEDRTYRAEVLSQALGEQFGAPDEAPVQDFVADAEFGDADQGPFRNDADLAEVRLAADETNLYVMARFAGMRDANSTALVILIDDPATTATKPGPGGITTAADRGFVVADNSILEDWQGGAAGPCVGCGLTVASNAADFQNTIEVSIPLSVLPDGPRRIGVASAVTDDTGSSIRATHIGTGKSDLINVAFRHDEPITIWMEEAQALALHAGSIDQYLLPVSIGSLQAGKTQTFTPRPGYYSRTYLSDSPANTESESGQYFQGPWQDYGLYLPTSWSSQSSPAVTWWTHYRGGHANDAAAWLPGLIHQLGEAKQRIMVTPSARGTSSWYVGRGMDDFLEVWDDVEASFAFDHDRVTMSGYSMGGYASYLLPLLMPDRFASSFPTSGPPTQGLWAGAGDATAEANGAYDADAQLMFSMLENARHVGYTIYHGTDDELVPYPGPARMASRLIELGYPMRFYTMPGYEHYSHAIIDDWRDAADHIETFRRPATPDHVTFRRWPALEEAVNTVSTPVPLSHRFDSAYYVSGLELRDLGTPSGGHADLTKQATIDIVTRARGVDETILVPEAGGVPVLLHSTPFVMVGQRRVKLRRGAPEASFILTLSNVGEVTLDLAGMGFSHLTGGSFSWTSDGPTTVHLVNGNATADLHLPAGSGSGSFFVQESV